MVAHKVVDLQQRLQSNLDETHVVFGVEKEEPQIQHEWIMRDLGKGVETEVVASHWHGKIHIIGTLRNAPFEKDSESMVNSGGHAENVEILEEILIMRGNMN